MIIISHRGLWKNIKEKNSNKSLTYSFKKGFGTETDLRDFNGELTISHDPPLNHNSILKNFNNIYNPADSLVLALNIKSDGIQDLVFNFVRKNKIKNYFVFDMSIPDTIGYLNRKMKVFSRQSEYELNPSFYDLCEGIWLDCFNKIWYDEELVLNHLNNGKKVAIVSADLHKRCHKKHWEVLRNWKCINNNNLILCTDFPVEAKLYFKK